jgi:hypothetical protein
MKDGFELLRRRKSKTLRGYSIAQKMSWAARRITTRKEDIAYCLLGIFGVNMPLLYGEAENAFRRLQEEILKRSDDRSIFAIPSEPEIVRGNSLFAICPLAFQDCHSTEMIDSSELRQELHSFSLTNRGFQFQDALIPLTPSLKDLWTNWDDRRWGNPNFDRHFLCLWNVEKTPGMTPAVVLFEKKNTEVIFWRESWKPLIELPTVELQKLLETTKISRFYVLEQ